MGKSDARFIVFDEDGSTVAEIPMNVRAVLSDEGDAVAISVELQQGGVIVQPEWVGMEVTLELSPKAVTQDRMTTEILAVARQYEVPVG